MTSDLRRSRAPSAAGKPIYGDPLLHIPEERLISEIARTPLDHYVVWTGRPFRGRVASIRARLLELVTESWTPVSLRDLVRRAARLSGDCGLLPERVRGAVRAHQTATGASLFLVRQTATGDFVAVTGIPMPIVGRPLNAGDLLIRGDGVVSIAGPARAEG